MERSNRKPFACLYRTLEGENKGSVKADNGAES